MTASDVAQGQATRRLFAGLAACLEGDPDHRAPLILLHGASRRARVSLS